MKFKFEIYQMESDNPNKFKELENTEINKSDYKKVYEGEVIVEDGDVFIEPASAPSWEHILEGITVSG